jgi:hypothetical protein
METGSILIKGSVNTFQNVRQGVSKVSSASGKSKRGLRELIEVFIDK